MRIAVTVAVMALAGCNGVMTAGGGCSDADTIETLRRVVQDNSLAAAGSNSSDAELIRQGWASGKVAMAVESIRTTAKDDAIKKSTCAAIMKVPLAPAVIEGMAGNLAGLAMLGAAGMKRSGDALAVDIAYSSQQTDDGKQVYVELQRGGEIARAAGVIVYAATVPAAPPAAPVAAAPPPAVPPPAPQAAAPTPTRDAAKANDDPQCQGLDLAVTADQLECLGRNFKAADADLNDAYKRVMDGFPEDRKTALRTEQRAWLANKAKACKEAGAEFAGGTMEAVARADCEVKQTKERAAFLAALK